ncbi:hypothetical protein D9613_004799 [Agrocybe pediades]|uniref:Uncharacterized protein n=1 Tax=Agrocybe pediades TaxID=84607 RepID=A0A8H4R049_9AGAR|nr:hypothetical protein D9613_004799 [Agrocybe pediades]
MASTPAKIRATPNPRLPKKLKHIGEQRFKNRFPRCKVVDEARPIDATEKGTSRRRKKTNQLDSSNARYAAPPVHENLVQPVQVHTGVAHASNVLFDDAVTTHHTSSAGVLDHGLGWQSTYGHLAYNDMDSESSMSDHSSVELDGRSEQWYHPVGQAGVYNSNTAPLDQYWIGHNISYPAPDMYEVGQLYGSYAYPYTTAGHEHTYAGQQTYGREEPLFLPPGEGMVPTTPYLYDATTDMSMNAYYAEDLGGSFPPTEEAFGRTW